MKWSTLTKTQAIISTFLIIVIIWLCIDYISLSISGYNFWQILLSLSSFTCSFKSRCLCEHYVYYVEENPCSSKNNFFCKTNCFFPKLNCQFSKIKLPVLIYWTHSYNHHSYLVCVFYYIWNIIIVQWCELTLNWLSTYTLYFGNFSTVYYIPQYHAMKGNTFILWCIYIYINLLVAIRWLIWMIFKLNSTHVLHNIIFHRIVYLPYHISHFISLLSTGVFLYNVGLHQYALR